MAKRSLASLSADELRGKRVLVRVDFNVPLDDAGAITDDTRIRAALPTINDLSSKGAKVILAAHFGRPKGQVNEAMRLTPVAARLSELLGKPVVKTDSCIGPEAEAKVAAMAEGDVVLLENVRFFAEEEKNDAGFAAQLAALADVYVNDAFGAAHRAHASTEGVTKALSPSVAGYLMAKAAAKGVQLLLPTDVVLADNFAPDANSQTVSIDAIPDGWMGLDIGPDSLKAFQEALADCKTVIWNGPMGVFEFDKFAAGTNGIAHTLADLSGKGCCTIIGGGDSVAAVEKVGVAEKMSHISTGGGASLELLEGKVLPGVAALDEA